MLAESPTGRVYSVWALIYGVRQTGQGPASLNPQPQRQQLTCSVTNGRISWAEIYLSHPISSGSGHKEHAVASISFIRLSQHQGQAGRLLSDSVYSLAARGQSEARCSRHSVGTASCLAAAEAARRELAVKDLRNSKHRLKTTTDSQPATPEQAARAVRTHDESGREATAVSRLSWRMRLAMSFGSAGTVRRLCCSSERNLTPRKTRWRSGLETMSSKSWKCM
eukprot:818482-Rhodomonas_salina.1